MNKALSATEVSAVLGTTWLASDNQGQSRISRTFSFPNFLDAWQFMSSVVPFINETDHHPEWVNVYGKVVVTLTTHDLGNKVSEKDVRLALEMNKAADVVRKK